MHTELYHGIRADLPKAYQLTCLGSVVQVQVRPPNDACRISNPDKHRTRPADHQNLLSTIMNFCRGRRWAADGRWLYDGAVARSRQDDKWGSIAVPLVSRGTVRTVGANPTGKGFCGDCGAPLTNRCPKCGAENPPGKRFCGDCGVAVRYAPFAMGQSATVVVAFFPIDCWRLAGP
jgi:hypothetical protein